MKRTLSLVLALCVILLCGCASTPEDTTPSTQATQPTGTTPAPTVTEPLPTETEPEPTDPEPTETEPTEPPVLYTNPLTGEAMDAPSDNRPYCIMLNNSQAAMPQHGVGEADILYETLIEGETRCMGIYYDISDVPTFGAIRSARKYFISLAQSYDAVYVHAGRSDEAQAYLDATGWDHIDGVHGNGAYKYYYRDQDRKNQGYAYEHTLFIRPDAIREYAEEMGCTFTREGGVSYGWNFDDNSITIGETANQVTAYFNMSGSPTRWHKSTALTYNEADKLYYASQFGSDYVDGNTGQTLSFRNVLVLRANTWVQEDNVHLTIELTGSGTGYFACNGMIVPIHWSRASENDPFVYTLENGTPITFGVGKTYIAIVPSRATVEWQ